MNLAAVEFIIFRGPSMNVSLCSFYSSEVKHITFHWISGLSDAEFSSFQMQWRNEGMEVSSSSGDFEDILKYDLLTFFGFKIQLPSWFVEL